MEEHESNNGAPIASNKQIRAVDGKQNSFGVAYLLA